MANPWPSLGDTSTRPRYTPFPSGTDRITSADGINLRQELHDILYGTGAITGKGHWVILRKFDPTQYSKYWNPVTREAVGGPAHPYTDHLVRTYRRLVTRDRSAVNADMDAPPGRVIAPYLVYYFEHTLNPRIGMDQIFELDWEDTVSPTEPVDVNLYRERYNITTTHKYRMDGFGRLEYWYCAVEENMGRW